MSQSLISGAIDRKSIIVFTYNGHPRRVEPHVLGYSKGVSQILGFQIGGSSSSGGIPEWRRFDIALMVGLQETTEKFPGQRQVPGRHSSWDQMLKVVAP